MRYSLTAGAVLAGTAAAIGNSRSFAVMHFTGGPLTEGRTDPIVSPGTYSGHVHTVMGSNAFSNSVTGDQLMKSTCTNAKLQADKSAYWMPKMYFRDQAKNTFEPVNLYYMNVYYFFEASNDKIEAFPVGLQMVSGDASKKTPPSTGNNIQDPKQGTIQPAQFTCPRTSYSPGSYPANSNGTTGGIQDTGNLGSGAGFPYANCDGLYSPLRADLHFPSCYDPSKALNDYKNNMVWPTDAGGGKQDCPKGFKHVPHLFYEMYWDTQSFEGRWTPNKGYQPFVLANGDGQGYSLHGDFIAAWDTTVLQHIIDTCDAGDSGMDKCPGNIGAITPDGGSCTVPNPSPETILGTLSQLPGNNPFYTFGSSGTNPPGNTNPTSTTTKKTSTATPTSTPTNKPGTGINGWSYAGCFHDTLDARALSGVLYADLGGSPSNTKCVAYCKSKGFSMAGMEYAAQCFCGNALSPREPLDESKCNMKCDGDASQICGGPDALSVYSASGSAKARRHLHRHVRDASF